jgi:hypothetical protein
MGLNGDVRTPALASQSGSVSPEFNPLHRGRAYSVTKSKVKFVLQPVFGNQSASTPSRRRSYNPAAVEEVQKSEQDQEVYHLRHTVPKWEAADGCNELGELGGHSGPSSCAMDA